MHASSSTLAFCTVLVGLAVLPAHAQQKLTPGLWETRVTIKQGADAAPAMAQMQKELAAMSPEQRKQVEQMMAQRGMAPGAPGGHSAKVCISKEQADRGDVPTSDDNRCKREAMQASGNTVKFKFSCSGDPPSTGEGQFTFISDKSYTGRMVVDTVVKGTPRRTEMEQAGQWLAADCGTLKPSTK